jgi:hypothetical protein
MENIADNSSAGTKRSWEGLPLHNNDKSQRVSSASMVELASHDVLSMFEGFRDELDQHHDRRERLIKISRDITALSKKMYAAFYILFPFINELIRAISVSSLSNGPSPH